MHVKHIVAFLARPDLKVELRCWTVDLLRKGAGAPHFAEHWDKVFALLASPSCEVQLQTLNLLEEKIPDEPIATYFHELLPVLHSKDSRIRNSSRRLLEQKVSADILAEHFHKIVPPLLADAELQPWSFGFLRGRIVERLVLELIDVIFDILCRTVAASSGKEEALLKFMEELLPSELSAVHVNHIAAFLARPDLKVELRCWTLDLLRKGAGAPHFAEHWDKVFALLASPSCEVQLQTLNLLEEKIPDEPIATYFHELLPVLHSKDSRIRDSSRRLLEQKVSADILAEHFHKIVPPLLADPELQKWSFGFLRGQIVERLVPELIDVIFSILCREEAAWSGKEARLLKFMKASLPSELSAAHVNHIAAFLARPDLKVELRCWTLDLLRKGAGAPHFAEHWDKVFALLASPSCEVQLQTLNLLEEKIPDEPIATYFHELLPVLHSKDSRIRDSSRRLLEQKVSADILAEHFHKIVPPLLADPELQKWSVGFLLDKMSDELIRKHSKQVAELLRVAGHLQNFEVVFMDLLLKKRLHQNSLAQLLSKLPISCLLLAMPRDRIASWRDEEGNTWLHVAAKARHLEACEALVDQVGLPLREKNKAGDEPLGLAANREVDRFLRSRIQFRETRFGYGNAFEEMMQDERQVSEVTWCTVPLPGMAGHLGGLHSFLVVTVSRTDQGAKSYVLEKAGSCGREAHQKHGVFIGNQGLSSNLRSVDGQKTRKQLKLNEGSLKSKLRTRELYEEAHSMGPYDVASSNCHHAVQKVFNHCCARKEDKEVRPPNEWLATLGAMFGGLFGPAGSGSEGSGSSEVASVSETVESPSSFTRSVDLCSDAFAELAAVLSLAVYEADAAMLLKPTEAGAVSIRNKLGQPVFLHTNNTQTKLKVQADSSKSVQTGGAERILVDVHAMGWVPGLCGWPLARRQAVWSGHAYDLSTDFRREVVLQEVVSLAPNQPVDVLHTAQKSGSTSPVQWFLVRSGSTLYASFRGTNDVQDVAIDVGAVPDYTRFEEHGIGVHSGIAHALEQKGDGIRHVVNDVLQALQEHLQKGERLVLCGHSLGGGYAQVMALHLLSRNLDVAAVRTFGAPYVLVPPKPGDLSILWQKLNSITQHWVHDWDPVPRLPLCKTWLTDVLPKLKYEVIQGVRIGIAQKYIQALQQHYDETRAKLLERYDVVGEVVLVSKATSVAFRASAGSAALMLGEKPPESVMTPSKLFAYHSMEDYLQIAHKLTAS